MENQYTQLNANTVKNMKAYQNQDANAVAIDSMLVNLRILLKKVLVFKKLSKELTQHKQLIPQNQVYDKINSINQQTKNLSLLYEKNIPPDKRMTNLFYMRIIKQISCYEKIIPSFSEILPNIEEHYSQQVKNQLFSITELYLICEKKFIQEIKILKNKYIRYLEEHKYKVISDYCNLQQYLIEKKNQNLQQKNLQLEQKPLQNRNLIKQCGNIFQFIFQNFHEQKTVQKPHFKNFNQVLQRSSKANLFLDFRQKASDIYEKLYSPLDIESIQIVTLFVPTLRPEDNIDFIYHKVNPRNKKSRKQIKQFQAQYNLFTYRKQQLLKRKIRRSQFRVKGDSIAKQKKNLLINNNNIVNAQSEDSKLIKDKKYSLKSIQFLKPIIPKQISHQRQRSVSRFRQKFEQSIEQSKQSSTFMKINNLNPIIGNHQKLNLSLKTKKKKTIEQIMPQNKQKQNNCQNYAQQFKKGKLNKGSKFQLKVSKFGQKRGRSLKNKSNKQIINKKLRL